MLIYSHKLTNRLRYIFKTIFTDVLLIDIEFTDDKDVFEEFDGPKISYSHAKLNSGIFFQSTTILFETGINEQNISVFEYQNNKCFYSVSKESTLPFDPFAASFYLISRYEEYLPHIKDNHERFVSNESLAFQHHFLETPLVNIWAYNIAKEIVKNYPSIKFPKQTFKFISTIDIDNAYAYKHKGFLRVLGGLLKALTKGNLTERIKVLTGKLPDPYDTFDYQFNIHKKYNISPIYFFLLGDYGLNDKNIPAKNKVFQSLIKSIADYYEVGIHPSYVSNSDEKILAKEIQRLQKITHKNVSKSRQHFLKLNLPKTYRNLIDNGIFEDFTMGYAERNGFRASICTPFRFYDLDIEMVTKLKVYPFAIMEATYQYYEKVSPENTIEKIKTIMQEVKAVNGTFVSVWHNESLSDEGIWKGWKNVYEQLLEEAKK
jgi:hypothetical protein